MQMSSGSKWKKKYFILSSDGNLQYGDSKKAKKLYMKLNKNTQISQLPSSELGGDYGFIITTPGTSQTIVLKNKSKGEANKWFIAVRDVINESKQEAGGRGGPPMADIYASSTMRSQKNLRAHGRSFESLGGGGGSEKSLGSGKSGKSGRGIDVDEGWVMKVGKNKNAPDFFVNSKTWEYYKSVEDSRSGKPCVGKALLSLLV